MKAKEANWKFSIQRLAGELHAVLSEPGKMNNVTPIREDQLPWFNALSSLLRPRIWRCDGCKAEYEEDMPLEDCECGCTSYTFAKGGKPIKPLTV